MTAPGALPGRSVAVLAVRMAVGGVLVVAGWVGARDEVALDRQTPWVAVTVVGALVAAASAALWLLEQRRAVTTRLLAVVTAVRALPEAEAVASTEVLRVRRRGGAGRLYHRPGCALVAGRVVDSGDASTFGQAGATACEACGA